MLCNHMVESIPGISISWYAKIVCCVRFMCQCNSEYIGIKHLIQSCDLYEELFIYVCCTLVPPHTNETDVLVMMWLP